MKVTIFKRACSIWVSSASGSGNIFTDAPCGMGESFKNSSEHEGLKQRS